MGEGCVPLVWEREELGLRCALPSPVLDKLLPCRDRLLALPSPVLDKLLPCRDRLLALPFKYKHGIRVRAARVPNS